MRRNFDKALTLGMAILAAALIANAGLDGWSRGCVLAALLGLVSIGLSLWLLHRVRLAQWKAMAVAPHQWERFRAVFADASFGMTLTDLQGRFLEVNPAFCRLVGYSAAELLALDFYTLTHPDDRDENFRLIQRLLCGEIPSFLMEKRYLRKDGDVVWSRTSVSLNRGAPGRGTHLIALCEDITERRETAEALRQSEARLREREEWFRTLADNMAQLAWMANASGWIFWYNRRWFDYTGTTLGEMEGWGWRKVHHPDHVGRVVAKIRRCFDTGEAWEDTFPLRGKDGSFRWFLSRALPIHDAGGRVMRWFGTNTDITDRLEMEEALRQADRRKDEFLAILAHELRNPLAPIGNALEIMQLTHNDAAATAEARTMIERQLRQLVRLVDDLLDVSRITRDKLTLRTERVELAAVVRDALETSKPLLEAADHELTIALPPEPIALEADRTRLAQVFANLLNNAGKFTPQGGRIWLIVERQGSDAVVTVRDTGVGISAELLPRIFEMFAQGDRALERTHGGLGIGLTLVRRLVELHGGRIEAHSAGPGQGAEFHVRLPIPLPAERGCLSAPSGVHGALTQPRSPDSDGHTSSFPPHRILVVDDNRDAADSLTMMLRLLGCEVETVYDGPEALSAAETFQPDIVLLDIGLPRMNGYEVCRQLRARPCGEGIAIVALTGWGQEEDRRRSREAGFDRHIVKPADPAALQAILAAPALNRSDR